MLSRASNVTAAAVAVILGCVYADVIAVRSTRDAAHARAVDASEHRQIWTSSTATATVTRVRCRVDAGATAICQRYTSGILVAAATEYALPLHTEIVLAALRAAGAAIVQIRHRIETSPVRAAKNIRVFATASPG